MNTRIPGPRTVLLISLGALGMAWLAAALAHFGWPFELFVHFRVQYAVAAALLTLGFCAMRMAIPALVAALLVAVQLWPGPTRALANRAAVPCADVPFTVVSANLSFRNREPRRFMDWLSAHPADLVVVQELTTAWAQALAELPGYPYREQLTREDPYGIAVLSKWPLRAMRMEDYAGDSLPSIAGYIATPQGDVYVAGLHTHWPLLPGLMGRRDATLEKVAVHARSQKVPVIVAGDLNATPYSPAFQRLIADSGLRDAFGARGWQPTWLARFWPLALRIDYVLASPTLCIDAADRGPEIGSDHRPVRVRLRFPAPG